jgi:hypothetical protein
VPCAPCAKIAQPDCNWFFNSFLFEQAGRKIGLLFYKNVVRWIVNRKPIVRQFAGARVASSLVRLIPTQVGMAKVETWESS